MYTATIETTSPDARRLRFAADVMARVATGSASALAVDWLTLSLDLRRAASALEEAASPARFIGDGIAEDFEHTADDLGHWYGPLPIDVLERDDEAAGPSDEDWDDYARWSEALDAEAVAEELHRLGYGR